MTTATDTPRPGAPWRFWLIAVLSLLWNSYGGYDYVMSQVHGDAYYREAHMTEAQIAFMHGYPTWMVAVWAIGVWGAVLGSILLLARSRFAYPVFVVSLAGFLLSLFYTYLLSDGGKTMGQSGVIMQLVVLAGCLFFLWYARRMATRGVLR